MSHAPIATSTPENLDDLTALLVKAAIATVKARRAERSRCGVCGLFAGSTNGGSTWEAKPVCGPCSARLNAECAESREPDPALDRIIDNLTIGGAE